jgi:hypothetical protein
MSDSSLSLEAETDMKSGKLVVPIRKSIKESNCEFDLNVSFSGGYVPNTELSRVDKG